MQNPFENTPEVLKHNKYNKHNKNKAKCIKPLDKHTNKEVEEEYPEDFLAIEFNPAKHTFEEYL